MYPIALLFPVLAPLLLVRSQGMLSPCPYNYPSEVNTTTTPKSFHLSVQSNNPLARGRNVQVRPSKPGDPSSPSIVVVDSSSPVLLSQLRNGALCSANLTEFNQLYDLGPTGGLTNVTSTPDASLRAFVVRNYGKHEPPESLKVRRGFFLLGGDAGRYNLYQRVPLNVANGFSVCEKKGYFRLFYETYRQC